MSSQTIASLCDLLSTYPPPFIFVHDPLHANPSPADAISGFFAEKSSTKIISIDARECVSSKIFFDAAVDQLMDWTPTLDKNGVARCWPDAQSTTWDKTVETFLQALKDGFEDLTRNARGYGSIQSNIVLVLQSAERLAKDNLNLVFALIRIRELSDLPITAVFISSIPWPEFPIAMGSSPAPYLVTLRAQSKQDVTPHLLSLFPSTPSRDLHNPILVPIYSQFLGVLYDSCIPYTNDPHEMAFMAYAMWPTFIRPLLEDWQVADEEERAEDEMDQGSRDRALPPPESITILIRHFIVGFHSAFTSLHTRQISVTAYHRANASKSSFRLSQRFGSVNHTVPSSPTKASGTTLKVEDNIALSLSRSQKLILVAAYIASFNPARTDLRMFGRLMVGSKRKRGRTAAGNRNAKKTKISQVLQGPASFSLERFMALYGALLSEHGDGEKEPFESESGEQEIEARRAAVMMTVTDLVQRRLIHRIGVSEKLDNNLALRCNITYEVAALISKDVGITLSELLWDPVD